MDSHDKLTFSFTGKAFNAHHSRLLDGQVLAYFDQKEELLGLRFERFSSDSAVSSGYSLKDDCFIIQLSSDLISSSAIISDNLIFEYDETETVIRVMVIGFCYASYRLHPRRSVPFRKSKYLPAVPPEMDSTSHDKPLISFTGRPFDAHHITLLENQILLYHDQDSRLLGIRFEQFTRKVKPVSQYDKDVDVLTIRVPNQGPIHTSDNITNNIIFDYNLDGTVIGIEILSASHLVR